MPNSAICYDSNVAATSEKLHGLSRALVAHEGVHHTSQYDLVGLQATLLDQLMPQLLALLHAFQQLAALTKALYRCKDGFMRARAEVVSKSSKRRVSPICVQT